MATVIQNQATINYNYEGGMSDAISNVVSTNILDQYGITATKTALKEDYRPGENMTYVTVVENNGSGNLVNIVIRDDLAMSNLMYLEDTARFYLNGEEVDGNVNVVATTLTLTYPGVLAPEDNLLVVYMARVIATLPDTVDEITNTQRIQANGGTIDGPIVRVTPNPTATITRASFAELSIVKVGSEDNIVSGDTLTYTFTITNTGNSEATDVVLTDTLPEGFDITSIQVTTNNVTTVYDPSQYTVDMNNTLTLPNATGPEIIVPAMVNGVPGITIVTVTGVVTI